MTYKYTLSMADKDLIIKYINRKLNGGDSEWQHGAV